jgi:hypothetical protein
MNSTFQDNGGLASAQLIYTEQMIYRTSVVQNMSVGESRQLIYARYISRCSGVYICMTIVSVYLLLARHLRSPSRIVILTFTASMFCVTIAWRVPSL